MKVEKKPEPVAELFKAKLRLGMIARMVRVSIEESPTDDEIPDVMETLLAACGQGEET
jgi:hypothetical protein